MIRRKNSTSLLTQTLHYLCTNQCEAWIQYMKVSFNISPYYSTVLILSKGFQILSRFNVNEMGSHWVLFLLYLNIVVLSWPEDGRSRPKHVAKHYLIVITASCLMYVVYWRYIIYYTNLIIHNQMASLFIKKNPINLGNTVLLCEAIDIDIDLNPHQRSNIWTFYIHLFTFL